MAHYLTIPEFKRLRPIISTHLKKSFGVLRDPRRGLRLMNDEAKQIFEGVLDTMDAIICDDEAELILNTIHVGYDSENECAHLYVPEAKRLYPDLLTEFKYEPMVISNDRGGNEIYYFTESERNALLDGLYGRTEQFNEELSKIAVIPHDRVREHLHRFSESLHLALNEFLKVTSARFTPEFISDFRAITAAPPNKGATLYSSYLPDLLRTYKRA